MPIKRLPPHPNLDHLKHQAKDLLRSHASRTPEVCQRIREFHPRFRKATDADIGMAQFVLSDAQLAIAREYGFASWARLRSHLGHPNGDLHLPKHERIKDADFRRAVDMLDGGDVNGLRSHLRLHPDLVHRRVLFEGDNYFTNPTLLEFVAENPTRRGRLPSNIVDVARVILDAGGEKDDSSKNSTLALVSSSSIARECKSQIPLIELLCERGADPNVGRYDALSYGEFAAAEALIRLGADIDLPTAAATGRIDVVRAALPVSDGEERQRALGFAAQHGHADIVLLLLDAGEDPNRFSPVGGHSHATPLHQAAGAGKLDCVRLLVERGARTDIADILFGATPLGWAEFGGHSEIAEFLRARPE
jgi:ankyrin repeat protein